jgi:hypothetical protein
LPSCSALIREPSAQRSWLGRHHPRAGEGIHHVPVEKRRERVDHGENHECDLAPGRDLVFFTGSGAGLIAPMVGGKVIQEVVAVARLPGAAPWACPTSRPVASGASTSHQPAGA